MANWKWAEKLLGKEEAYVVEDDVNYDESGYEPVSARPAAAPEAPRQTGAISSGASASLEMKIVKPDRFEDVTTIADHLLQRRTVVLNLENTGKESIRRILDFLSGTVYAIEGNMKRAANSTYVITPKNVDVSADLDFAGDKNVSGKELY
ncbi:MAG: cell division protein SepF [Ruminococcaceae bacterium]|nr:cell division protein SepF [Oscillospiraceae bacterium]